MLIEATWTLARSSKDRIETKIGLLSQALAEADKLGLNTFKWQIELDFSDALEIQGDAEKAAEHRMKARETLELIAGRIVDPELKNRFHSAPNVAKCLSLG